MKKKIDIAVVGASGMVGGELLDLLEKRRFPVGEFYAFNSGRRAAEVVFRGRKYRCLAPSPAGLGKARLIFFVSTDEVSASFAKKLAAAGAWCIDDSSYFRLDPAVPLVIPEVNGGELSPARRLVAGPNCTITGAAVSLAGIHARYGIKELRIATYQAVSGAGRRAMDRLHEEVLAVVKGRPAPEKSGPFPRPIAFNLFPQVGGFDCEGRSSEENKVAAELKKIWRAPGLRVSCTAVRVPVLRGHSLALWATTRKPWTLRGLSAELRQTPGLKFFARQEDYPCPLTHGDRTAEVYAGRLRPGAGQNEFQLWTVSDNLYKGAALNSVQVAELLLKKGCLDGGKK
jgi:aspartate-semialdehyde dehydrogenase